jgi:mannosyltransferase
LLQLRQAALPGRSPTAHPLQVVQRGERQWRPLRHPASAGRTSGHPMAESLLPQSTTFPSRLWASIGLRRLAWSTELASPLRFVALLAPLLAIALVLRVLGVERRGIWFDEGVGVEIAQRSIAALLAATQEDVHPPLYYLLLHFWLVLGSGDLWLRLPSIFFGTITVLMTALVGRALFDDATGLLAATLVAISPFMIDLSQEGRDYALFSALATTSFFLLQRAQQRGGWSWLAYVAVLGLNLYTHNFAWFLVAAEGLYLLVLMAMRRRFDGLALASVTAGVLLYVPWIPGLVAQVTMVARGNYWILPVRNTVLSESFLSLAFYSQPGWGPSPVQFLAGLAIIGALGMALAWPWRAPQVLLPALLVPVTLACSVLISLFVTPILVPRYLAFTVPSFWLVVAFGLQRLHLAIRFALLAVIVAAVGLNLQLLYAGDMDDRSDMRAATSLILREARPGDLVVNTSRFAHVPFTYYSGDRIDAELLSEESPEALAEAVEGRSRFWYVRDFAVFDDLDLEQKEQLTQEVLRRWPILAQYRLNGALMYLVKNHPG